MIIRTNSIDLKKALDAVMEACPSRPAYPAYGCVHMSASLNEKGEPIAVLSCQDGTMEIRRWLKCNMVEPGEALIQAKLLRDYVSVMPGEISISCGDTGEKCTLSSGRKKCTIPALPADSYKYSASALDSKNSLVATLPPAVLSRFVSCCAHCASQDMNRLALTGLFLELDGSLAKATCTNGFVFSHVESPATVYSKASLLIPIASLQKAAKLLASSNTDVAISANGTLCRMDGDVMQITFSLLAAQYIDYHRLMHTDAPTNVLVSSKELLSCVRQCTIAASDHQSGGVTIRVENGEVSVSASSAESEAVSQTDCLLYGAPVQVTFNGRYVADALERTMREAENVTMLFKGKIAPCAFIPEVAPEDKPYAPYFIVLPVRTL